jgi:hypothetical protein
MDYFRNGIKLLFVALLLVTTACGSGSSVKQSNKTDGTDGSDYMTLEDHLRRINGVRVTGSGDYAKVVLRPRGISGVSRGVSSSSKGDPGFGDSNQRQPLFVVDGQVIGQDYPTVRDMFAQGEIKSVKLLPESEASQYGSQSGYGVIEITTNSDDSNSGN